MEWTDRGIVLGRRKHGETAVILEILARDRGRYKGVVKGGAGSRMRGLIQPGNEVRLTWRARLSEHIGTFTSLESHAARAASLMASPLKLAIASSAFALASLTLPEREPHQAVFDGLAALLDGLETNGDHPEAWAAAYVAWEAELLRELGFGFDLSSCAVTGSLDGLAYVSPRTGQAVTSEGAGEYRNRLLPLPPFLTSGGRNSISPEELRSGFALTGHFLDTHLLNPHNQTLPPARARLVERFAVPGTP
jgi:DNA repair protein RecO (recombination protein O)